MKIDLTGKTAVISGGSGGLGEAMAHVLTGAGAHVALVARNEDKLKKVAAQFGDKASIFVGDASKEDDVARILAEVKARHGDANILINNAGTNLRKNLVDFTLEEFSNVVDSSLITTFLMCRAFVPGMQGKGYGRVINLASMLANVSLLMRTAYSAGKSALLGLTRSLALELAADGITVNVVAPGPIHTDMFYDVIPAGSERERKLAASIPAGRVGEPGDVARAVAFFADSMNGFVTGQTLYVCGGASLGSISL
jgi:NAD(P)-dependent dehydrogenase (short-subunit alcohol dehydrogenase family)